MRFCVWNPRVHREDESISERRLLTYGCETRRGIEYKQKDLWCARRRILLVPGGDWRADYGAGAGLAALWGVHTFLSVAKEKCAKESQRHGTTGKSPLLPILTAGLATSRAISLASYLLRSRALLCSPFSAVKMGGLFFPSLPNAALLPRSWHRADSNSGAWELQRSLAASQRRETDLIFSFTVGARHA